LYSNVVNVLYHSARARVAPSCTVLEWLWIIESQILNAFVKAMVF